MSGVLVGERLRVARKAAECHQAIHALLGNLRLKVKDRQIIGLARVR